MSPRQFDLYVVERECVERFARIGLWITVAGIRSGYWVAHRIPVWGRKW